MIAGLGARSFRFTRSRGAAETRRTATTYGAAGSRRERGGRGEPPMARQCHAEPRELRRTTLCSASASRAGNSLVLGKGVCCGELPRTRQVRLTRRHGDAENGNRHSVRHRERSEGSACALQTATGRSSRGERGGRGARDTVLQSGVPLARATWVPACARTTDQVAKMTARALSFRRTRESIVRTQPHIATVVALLRVLRGSA